MKGKKKTGNMSATDIQSIINNIAGNRVSYSLSDTEHPSNVSDWISTGSRVLDSTIAKGKMAGVPMGRITCFAGMPSTGKSFICAQIACNAQKKGYPVVYFDTEASIDPQFLIDLGIKEEGFTYVQPDHVEMILEIIEGMLDATDNNGMVFIWDSLAATPTRKEYEEASNDPGSNVALRPRIIALGLKKILNKLANTNSALIITNQLITNIPKSQFDHEAKLEPLVTPGGNALKFAYSLEIWLTRRKAKAALKLDEFGHASGAEVVATLRKSRFGTEKRQCAFDIEWGSHVGIADKESWLDVVLGSPKVTQGGAWYTLNGTNGKQYKFQTKNWLEKLDEADFLAEIEEILDYELIHKFVTAGVASNDFYNVEQKMADIAKKISTSGKDKDEDE